MKNRVPRKKKKQAKKVKARNDAFLISRKIQSAFQNAVIALITNPGMAPLESIRVWYDEDIEELINYLQLSSQIQKQNERI